MARSENILDINCARVDRAPTYMEIPARGLSDPSYEGSSRQMHPSIISIPGGWPVDNNRVRPRKLWLAVTPMVSTEVEENPHLFVRDDFDGAWTYIIGRDSADSIVNPIFRKDGFILDTAYWYSCATDTVFYSTTDGRHDSVTVGHRAHHLSDPDLFLGDDSDLWIAFRVSWSVSGIDMSAIYAAHSGDGRNWTKAFPITHLGRFMSPAVIFDSLQDYTMFCTAQPDDVSGISDNRQIYKFSTNRPESIWEYQGQCNFNNKPRHYGTAWHLDVLPRPSGELIAIVQTVSRSALWLAQSVDQGQNWTIADQPLLRSIDNDSTLWDAILYRASGYWMDETCLRMGLVYSAYKITKIGAEEAVGYNTIWHTGFTVVTFSGER